MFWWKFWAFRTHSKICTNFKCEIFDSIESENKNFCTRARECDLGLVCSIEIHESALHTHNLCVFFSIFVTFGWIGVRRCVDIHVEQRVSILPRWHGEKAEAFRWIETNSKSKRANERHALPPCDNISTMWTTVVIFHIHIKKVWTFLLFFFIFCVETTMQWFLISLLLK